MAHVVSFSNQKGGVGKTTSCVNLASYVASSGYKVLLVDLDPQANATSTLGVFDKNVDNSIYGALFGQDVTECVRCGEEFDFIPSSQDLISAELELKDAPSREYALKNVLDGIGGKYNFIFIDCPPTIGLLLVNALTASNGVIIPLQCEYFALEGLNQLLNTVRLVKKHLNKGLQIDGILLTMFGKTRLATDVENEVRNLFGNKVFLTKIPRNVRLSEAPSYAKTIRQYDNKCAGARAYASVASEFISQFKE